MTEYCKRCDQPLQLVDSYRLAPNYPDDYRIQYVYRCRNENCDLYLDRQYKEGSA